MKNPCQTSLSGCESGAGALMAGAITAILVAGTLTPARAALVAENAGVPAAMAATGGNKLATARMLGISRATLYERLENPEK